MVDWVVLGDEGQHVEDSCAELQEGHVRRALLVNFNQLGYNRLIEPRVDSGKVV